MKCVVLENDIIYYLIIYNLLFKKRLEYLVHLKKEVTF